MIPSVAAAASGPRGTNASAKHSPLDQVNAANAAGLRIAWCWTSPDQAVRAAKSDIERGATAGIQADIARRPDVTIAR